MKRPNILLITCDQLRRDALGVYGNRVIKTPNIDALSTESVIFDNHFTQHPVCTPSRWSIFTGRYPRSHGVRDNGVIFADNEPTLARTFKKNGYYTGAFGKMHFTPALLNKVEEDEQWPKDDFGFSVTELTDDSKRGTYLEYLKTVDEESYRYVLKQGEEKVKEDLMSASDRTFDPAPQIKENKLDPSMHQTSWITDRCIDFIDKAAEKNRPFFGWCSFVDPHHPFDPPEPYASMYDPKTIPLPGSLCPGEDAPQHIKDMHKGFSPGNEKYDLSTVSDDGWQAVRAKYYGMVSLIDYNVGRIIRRLREKEVFNDTLILFTTDHGELLGDHGLLFKGPFHYDSLIRVPLIVKYGDRFGGGMRVGEITQHVDIFPTLASAAGVSPPQGLQGNSLQGLLEGAGNQVNQSALIEHCCHDWGFNVKTLRTKRWRLTYYGSRVFGELYDLLNDPTEQQNLWKSKKHRRARDRLIRALLDKLIETEDTKQPRLGRY